MQNLGVISVNLWQIIVSLLNLVLMFLILKRFLWKPVKRMWKERQGALDGAYRDAEEAKKAAMEAKATYTERLEEADKEAEGIVARAALARKKAKESIRADVVVISTALAEQMLRREINAEDHKELFDDFLAKVGEDDGKPC